MKKLQGLVLMILGAAMLVALLFNSCELDIPEEGIIAEFPTIETLSEATYVQGSGDPWATYYFEDSNPHNHFPNCFFLFNWYADSLDENSIIALVSNGGPDWIGNIYFTIDSIDVIQGIEAWFILKQDTMTVNGIAPTNFALCEDGPFPNLWAKRYISSTDYYNNDPSLGPVDTFRLYKMN